MADPIRILLIAGIAASALWGAAELREQPRLPLPASVETADLPDSSGSGIAAFDVPEAQPLDDFTVVLERPLFTEDRKPYPVDVQGQPNTDSKNLPMDLRNVRLSAIVADGEHYTALIAVQGDEHPRRLTQGDSLADWRVTEIADTYLVLQSGARRQQLQLMQFDKPQPAARVPSKNRPRLPVRRLQAPPGPNRPPR